MGRPRKNSLVFRADDSSVTAKDASIKEIALLMASGTWHPYRSALSYSVTSGLTPSTVADYAKDAARLLRLAWTDESSRSVVMEKIQKLGEDAANRTEEVLDKEGRIVTVRKPDYKSAIHAAEVLATILGMTKTQHELKVTYERMTDDQLMGEAMKFLNQTKARVLPEVVETTSDEREEAEVEDAELEGCESER